LDKEYQNELRNEKNNVSLLTFTESKIKSIEAEITPIEKVIKHDNTKLTRKNQDNNNSNKTSGSKRKLSSKNAVHNKRTKKNTYTYAQNEKYKYKLKELKELKIKQENYIAYNIEKIKKLLESIKIISGEIQNLNAIIKEYDDFFNLSKNIKISDIKQYFVKLLNDFTSSNSCSEIFILVARQNIFFDSKIELGPFLKINDKLYAIIIHDTEKPEPIITTKTEHTLNLTSEINLYNNTKIICPNKTLQVFLGDKIIIASYKLNNNISSELDDYIILLLKNIFENKIKYLSHDNYSWGDKIDPCDPKPMANYKMPMYINFYNDSEPQLQYDLQLKEDINEKQRKIKEVFFKQLLFKTILTKAPITIPELVTEFLKDYNQMMSVAGPAEPMSVAGPAEQMSVSVSRKGTTNDMNDNN
jgi:hypothetical protein